MPIGGSPIYLSTSLLEKNRHNGKGPSLLVSDWIEPAGEAGFAGLDIWMNHLLFASRSEWELIREKASESDLTLAFISAALPGDATDKTLRLREALLEACEYFRPDGLKLARPEGRSQPGSDSEWLASLRSLSGDFPRETTLFCEARAEDGPAGLDQARKALAGKKCKGVVYPFLLTAPQLEASLEAAGDYLGHLGVQARKGDRWILLEDGADEHMRLIAMTRRRFQGTWSLNFTEGAGLPGEDIEDLFDHAEKDLNFLTDALARAIA